jgi:hypothetical protein
MDDKMMERVRAKLLPKYRMVVSALLDTLEKSGQGMARDFPEAASVGHKFKGNGAMYGFPDLTTIGGDLEAAAQRKDPVETDRLARELAITALKHGLDPRKHQS